MKLARLRSFVAAAGLAASLGVSAAVPGIAASTTVTVTPATLSAVSWYFYDDANDIPSTTQDLAHYKMVSGPGVPPAGVGSVFFHNDPEDTSVIPNNKLQRWNIATSTYGNTPLSSLTALKFNTFVPSAGQTGGCANVSNECDIYLNFDVDFGPGVCPSANCPIPATGYQKRLAYVPGQNGTVAFDTWQEWDAAAPGALWTWSGYDSFGHWPDGDTNRYRTWGTILAAFPAAHVNENVGSSQLLFRSGEPYAGGFNAYLDKATIGVGGNDTVYDFEPLVGPPTSKDQCKGDGWKQFNAPSFKNQGDCVSYVATGGKNPGNGR